ncbi:MAG: hypothetical protein K2O02_05315, partial [Lachnospiraceae bacterium]|nr:hypothetical protein [Lachnospiraceae bacterium]
DCMAVGAENPESCREVYFQILKYKKIVPNPMVTEKAKRIWEEKKKLVNDFMEELKKDLFLE